MKPYRTKRWLIVVLVILIVGMAGYGAVAGTRPFTGKPYSAASEPYQGAGGDPALLDVLIKNGVVLGQVNDYALSELQLALKDNPGQFILYRGQVRHNLLRRGLGGFQVCAYGNPFTDGPLKNATGVELACAVTNPNGYFTFVGLPGEIEITFITSRPGFLKLAFTTRTVMPPLYEQDFVGNVPVYLVKSTYQSDPAHPFCAAGNCPQGEMIFTVIHEPRSKNDPLYGYVSPGMYVHNGQAHVTIQVFTDPDHAGTFAVPYPTTVNSSDPDHPQNMPDGLVYSGTVADEINHVTGNKCATLIDFLSTLGLRSILYEQEYPQSWRNETSNFGLALLKYIEPGIYEAQVTHPTMACYPTRDSWRGSTPDRVRFEVTPGTLGDVRFYCK